MATVIKFQARLLLFVSLLFLTGCKEHSALKITLSMDNVSVALGDTVRFRLVLSNQTNGVVSFAFPSGLSHDFEVYSNGASEPLWRWSDGRMFNQMLHSVHLASRDSIVFEGLWRGDTERGHALLGKYTVKGKVFTLPPLKDAVDSLNFFLVD